MKLDEAKVLLRYLSGAYPHVELTEDTIAAWTLHLAPLPYEATRAAVRAHVERSRFFPTIAEIRHYVFADEGYPTLAEAWGQVIEGANNETRKGMHPIVRKVFDQLIGGFWEPNLGVHTRRLFLEAFTQEVERDRAAQVRALTAAATPPGGFLADRQEPVEEKP